MPDGSGELRLSDSDTIGFHWSTSGQIVKFVLYSEGDQENFLTPEDSLRYNYSRLGDLEMLEMSQTNGQYKYLAQRARKR